MKIKKIFQAILPCKETRLWFLFLVAVELFILWTLFVFPNYVKTNCSPRIGSCIVCYLNSPFCLSLHPMVSSNKKLERSKRLGQ